MPTDVVLCRRESCKYYSSHLINERCRCRVKYFLVNVALCPYDALIINEFDN